MERVFTPPTLTPEVKSLFQKLDDYDDPCMIFLYAKSDEQWRDQILKQAMQQIDSCSEVVPLSEEVSFCLCFCNVETIQVVAFDIERAIESNDTKAFISIFRHDCLSNPAETFHWGGMQLEKLLETNKANEPVAINDFQDKVNWPGIEQYQEPKPIHSDMSEKKQKSKTGWLSRICQFWCFAKSDATSLGFEPTPMLEMIKPFITTLPNGPALWQFVLNGEGEDKLQRANAFIDLDHILLLPHAHQHAPAFFEHILSLIERDFLPDQHDLQADFFSIMAELSDELLASNRQTAQKQVCYLRILDIFYHIFDQQPWPTKFFAQLVENEKTACLDSEAYQRRFTQPHEQSIDSVPAKLKQDIFELLDELEDYSGVYHEQWLEIERCFDTNRQAVHPDNWPETEMGGRLLLASVLLYKDKQANIEDNNTHGLRKLLNDHLLDQVVEKIRDALSDDCQLPETFENWLNSEQACIDESAIQQLSLSLADDIGLDSSRTKQTAQPHSQLFGDVSDFQSILASCFWFQLAEPSHKLNKVTTAALQIAPQATLSCFTRLFAEQFGEITLLPTLKSQMLRDLTQVGVAQFDLKVFEVRLSQNHNLKCYTSLLSQYAHTSPSEQMQWDEALAKITPFRRDMFYLDVFRLFPSFTTPLCTFKDEMLTELIRATLYSDADFIGTQFDKEDVLFCDHIMLLGDEFNLPIKQHEQLTELDCETGFAVFVNHGKYLSLIVKPKSAVFEPDGSELIGVHAYVILTPKANLDKLSRLVSDFKTLQQRSSDLLQGMQHYLSGACSFQEYQTKYSHFSDTKQYDVNIEHYTRYRAEILPQILAEPNETLQLRLIKLLCSHKARGSRVLEGIAEQLFFDYCLAHDMIDFTTRHDKELKIGTLTKSQLKVWQGFYVELNEKLSKLD